MDIEKDFSKLPRWKCHKIVRASQIRAFDIDEDHINATVWLQPQYPVGREFRVLVSAGVFARGHPSPGDYLVVYDDGYVSWSPQGTFEAGYEILDLPQEA